MTTESPKAVVSAILEKTEGGVRYVFLQTRWKPVSSSTYSGLLEIPAGGIDGYENVVEALKREVREETGLEVVRLNGETGQVEENIPGSKAMIFRPFVCQQMLSSDKGLPWVGFVFRCEVTGVIKINTDEAKDPRWVTIGELKKLLEKPSIFFPLQYPVLKYYAEHAEEVAVKQ